jgi:hypothetical protein
VTGLFFARLAFLVVLVLVTGAAVWFAARERT